MPSRQNINGRPRPSGVLPRVQAGPAAGLADPTPTPVGPVAGAPPTGSARGRGTGRRGRGGGRGASRVQLNGEINGNEPPPPTPPPPPTQPPPTDEEFPYPPGKGPTPPPPPHKDQFLPGGSRSGGGAGYRARTSKIARETTEAQTRAGRQGRFGQDVVKRTAPTRIPYGGSDYGRRYGSGPHDAPRWATSAGGGGYGTTPDPLPPPPPPPPPPEPPPPTVVPPGDRDGRGGRGGRGGGRRGGRSQEYK